jgi:hypothetical protein
MRSFRSNHQPKAHTMDFRQFMKSEFAAKYAETALWSSVNDDEITDEHGILDIHPYTLTKMYSDCLEFEIKHARLIERLQARHDEATTTQIAHDFWLTRCGHGVGFWIRGYGVIGDLLTEAAETFGNVDLCVGDDGMIHQS